MDGSQKRLFTYAYVGKRIFDRIPPLHGALGICWVSSLRSSLAVARGSEVSTKNGLVICAWGGIVSTEVRSSVAAVAILHLHLGVDFAVGWVPRQHTETLKILVSQRRPL
jgi:hypothetical protein